MPTFIFESAFSIRIPLVSAFLPEITQQIHSLRASGVMASQSARAAGIPMMASRRSAGIVCTTPPAIFVWLMRLFYQIRHPLIQKGYFLIKLDIKKNRRPRNMCHASAITIVSTKGAPKAIIKYSRDGTANVYVHKRMKRFVISKTATIAVVQTQKCSNRAFRMSMTLAKKSPYKSIALRVR